MIRSYPGPVAGCQTSPVTSVIPGTWRSVCQRAAIARANSVSSETIRTLASFKGRAAPLSSSGLESFRFFHEGEQSFRADSEVHGSFGVFRALGLFDAPVKIRDLVARERKSGGQRALVSRPLPAIGGNRQQRPRYYGAPQILRLLAAFTHERRNLPGRK